MFKSIPAFVLFFVISVFSASAQSEYTTHFIWNAPQSSYTNPAFRTGFKHHVMLPSVMYNYGNNAFSYNDLIKKTSNGDSIFIDGDKVISQMKDNNIILLQSNIDILGFSFSYQKWYFTVTFSEKLDAQFKYPKELMQLLWDGNAQFVGQSAEIGPGINATYYKDLSLGVNYSFEKFDVGTRIRMLNGVANIYSKKHQLTLTTASEYYNTSLNSDYEIYTAGLESAADEAASGFKFNHNPGMAFDLGVNVRASEKFEWALSITDLGWINWRHQVKTYRSKGSFQYNGVDINDLIDSSEVVADQYLDSLKDLYFEETIGGTYRSSLIPKMYLSGLYKLNPTTNFGALINLNFFNGVQPGFSVFAGKELSSILDVGLTYNIKNRRYFNFGGYVSVGPKAFRVFLSTDNLVTLFAMRSARTVTLRFGMNVNLNRRDKEKEQVEEIEN